MNDRGPGSMQKPVASQIPRGVGCPPPPGMDTRKGKGKLMCIKVRMLDDTVGVFHLGHKAIGQALFDEVCRHLNLLESDYFGLEFIDSYGNRCWLDKEKSILRQIMAAQSDARFFFIIKFYTPNPAELEEEYTRYLFALQIRRDLARGELICNENTAALLVSFIVQSECGDFSSLDYPDHSYLSASQFVPNQSPAFQHRIMEQHKKLVGMSPAEADFSLLETARRCDFYGIRLHSARDLEGIEVALSVCHLGIKVFHQLSCVTTFSWAKVRKLSFKRKRLMIKIHADSAQQYKETIEFQFENRDDCKNFWKKCVEHHSFFRCQEPTEPKRDSSSRRIFHRGSHFHYQGRTQKQLIDYVREHRKRREPFERPLRRSGAPGTMVSNFATASQQQQTGTAIGQQQQRGTALFVSDRMAAEFRLDNNNGHGAMPPTGVQQQRHVNFPSMCQKGVMNGGGSRKARPKSALLDNGSLQQSRSRPNVDANGSGADDPMQNSCYGAIIPTANGSNPNAVSQQQQQQAFALFHQQMDPMSMSLPNVLAPSALQTDHCCFYAPNKSLSGENFHGLEQHRHETDNQSEGSYRLGGDTTGTGFLNSSQSDIGSASVATTGPVDRRIYQTTFTTKRVGNVVVKKVNNITAAPVESQRSSASSCCPRQPNRRPQPATTAHQQQTTSSPATDQQPTAAATTTIASLEAVQIGSGCSSAGCSDYSIASSSAALASSNKGGGGGRIRYAPGSGGQALATRLRHEVPVAIDGPPAGVFGGGGSASANGTPTPIIRPVLIPSPPGARRFSSSSASTSAQSTPTQATAIHRDGAAAGGRRPLVLKTAAAGTDFAGGRLGGGSTGTRIVPVTAVNAAAATAMPSMADGPPKEGMAKCGSSTTTANGGPVPGRVVRREDLVITPNGIELKKQTVAEGRSITMHEAANTGSSQSQTTPAELATNKPKVPPKPAELLQGALKIQSLNGTRPVGKTESKEEEAEADQKAGDKAEEDEQQRRALLDPLESILKDVQALNQVLGDLPAKQQPRLFPTAIAIQSEERPDLKTVHLFSSNNEGQGTAGSNSGAGVPYTLTVRDLSARLTSDTEKEVGGGTLALGAGKMNKVSLCEHASRHSKPIELVNRRRLPSQDSYSSQDHSISPTSPDSGNVLEYVLRKRSQSSDRATTAGGQHHQKTFGHSKRSAERRLTQPIELGSMEKAPTKGIGLGQGLAGGENKMQCAEEQNDGEKMDRKVEDDHQTTAKHLFETDF